MKLHLFTWFNQTGIGRHGENFYRAILPLAAGKFDVTFPDIDDNASISRMLAERTGEDVMLAFIIQDPQFLQMVKGKKILWLAFESSRIPTKWRDNLALYDAIWAPSQWGREVMIQSGVPAEKIAVMPEGVDAATYRPASSPHDGFVFLSVGKYEKRKGINELIQAFLAEFPREKHPKIFLWLKADFPMLPQLADALKESVGFDDRIKVISGKKTDAEMIALYNSADAFVFPSRAEGFGLPCLEAIACGLPVAATHYSGQTEYLREIDGLYIPIAHEMEDIEDFFFDHFYKDIYAGEPYGQWAKPDIPSIQKGMRQIYGNQQPWKDKAARASEIVREKLDWSCTARKAVEELLRK